MRASLRTPVAVAALLVAVAVTLGALLPSSAAASFDRVTVLANQFDPTLQHNIPNLVVARERQSLEANFLDFYDRTGGLTRWGYPTSEVFEETSGMLTQYFQRGVVDWQPAPGGGAYTLQRRLAWDFIGGGLGGAPDLGVEPGLTNPQAGDPLGPWGHKLSNWSVEGTYTGFKDFFYRLGGVDSFGFPKTDARRDDHPDAVLTVPGSSPGFIRQYFQAAVLEYHPEDANDPVKLGLIGDTVRNLLYPDDAWAAVRAFQPAQAFRSGQVLQAAVAPRAEYGDAPDGGPTGYSTGFAQTGQFPSLFASGGAHALSVKEAILGTTASVEVDADDPADPDGVPNLTNADPDDGIVGLTLLLTGIPPPATLTVRVSGAPSGPFYLNVLIDLNMDGRWGGTGAAGEPEWVVQNYPVPPAPEGTVSTVSLPAFAFANGNSLPDGAWMRIALTKEIVTVTDWDGTGSFSAGEIEDHVISLPLMGDGDGKRPAIPVGDCNGPYRFEEGQLFLGFECTITNLGAVGGVEWVMEGPLTGGVWVDPQSGGPFVLGAGVTTILSFTAWRDGLPSTWRFRAYAVDPESTVTEGGVTVGYSESQVPVEFEAEAGPVCMVSIHGIATGFEHYEDGSAVIFYPTVVDSSGQAVAGATVVGEVSGPLGTMLVEGITGHDGVAEIGLSTTAYGDYSFTVLDIVADGCLYDAHSNLVTSAALTLEAPGPVAGRSLLSYLS